MFTVTDPSGSAANNLSAVRSSLSETFVGNWTTVVVRADIRIGMVRETQAMEMAEPIRSILGSLLEAESGNAKLDVAAGSAEGIGEIPETNEMNVSTPISSILVDLAICHLNLSVL